MRVAADSQCFSFLIDAINGITKPTDGIAEEKIALFRTYLYLPGTLYATPTVLNECAQIRDTTRKELHDSYFMVLFDEVFVKEEDRVLDLSNYYSSFHSGKNDCLILAEAELASLDVLLSYDTKFISRLAKEARRIRLLKPSTFWSELAIPKGSRPDKRPKKTNPLRQQDWWVWQ